MTAFHVLKTPVTVKVMTVDGDVEGQLHLSPFALWARLPFQALFIAWAWWLSRD